jgi:hypothetical protein
MGTRYRRVAVLAAVADLAGWSLGVAISVGRPNWPVIAASAALRAIFDGLSVNRRWAMLIAVVVRGLTAEALIADVAAGDASLIVPASLVAFALCVGVYALVFVRAKASAR